MAGDLETALQRAARELEGVAPRPGLDARVHAATQAPPRWRWALLAVPVVAALLLVLAAWPRAAGPAQLGGFAVVAPTEGFSASAGPDGVVTVAAGEAQLVDAEEGQTLAVQAEAVLRRAQPGAQLLRGTIEVTVAHRTPGQPALRIGVSDGAIEVLGTRFRVEQGASGGRVVLHEGSIRFVATDGRQRLLRPGEELRWPLADEVVPEPTVAPAPAPLPTPVAPTRPKRTRPAAPAPVRYVDADDLLRQVDVLRTKADYAEAVRYLTTGLARELRRDSRERFSFELGIILTDQLAEPRRACAQWARHTKEFGAGRYGREVTQAAARAGCSP
jgi:transmembrane sensor